MERAQYVVVVGCGRLGSILASRLSGQGHSVVVIDWQESTFNHLATEFSGFQIVGDASELAILRQAKTDKADCLLAVTGEDNLNLMVAQVAQVVFKVKTVLARVLDPEREHIYREFGIATISPTDLSADAFLQAFREALLENLL
ncbi:MAG: TrkA family potassium uptake protein [Leptolyngbyaceae cyanobacterium MO_188.B28]|nr:TrkA family potassium uptake protein [Leptolyngbyaceae cyanobacterium MO_188.B28]